MKKVILFEILKRLKAVPGFHRKLKIFGVVALLIVVVSSSLVVWAGVAAIGFVTRTTQEAIAVVKTQSLPIATSPDGSFDIRSFDSRVLGGFQALGCWGKVQTLMRPDPWLAMPVADNLKNLKLACFESGKSNESTEGSTI